MNTLPKTELNAKVHDVLFILTGMGLGLMLAASFLGIEKWAVTSGLILFVTSILLRLVVKK